MAAYYNEIEPFAAQWLRNLIAAGHIAAGDVDERSIVEVQPDDLRGYTQCHFFAGIGGWSLALRLAGWPDDRPVGTGSAPCQPYSVASVAHGGAQGQGDERDLWPALGRIILQRRFPMVFGEQVASAVAWGWWDRAAVQLESAGYACAAAILRADAYGADHQRRRLYWAAHAGGEGWEGHKPGDGISGRPPPPLAIVGNPLDRARHYMERNLADLLPCDGVSVAVERCAAKGYGNAIVPQVAAAFIRAAA